MKLIVIGSGSKGNGYVLTSGKETLIIECGMPFKAVKKAIDFKTSTICGAIISHSHSDHCGHLKQYENCGFPIFQPYLETIPPKKVVMGGFTIRPFLLIHDAACYGYLIEHEEFGRMLFITDTEYVKYNFKSLNINYILVEANYSNELVTDFDDEGVDGFTKVNHVLQGHMELETTCRFLSANATEALKAVLLIHLSNSTADNEMFLKKANKAVQCDVSIAESGLVLEMEK